MIFDIYQKSYQIMGGGLGDGWRGGESLVNLGLLVKISLPLPPKVRTFGTSLTLKIKQAIGWFDGRKPFTSTFRNYIIYLLSFNVDNLKVRYLRVYFSMKLWGMYKGSYTFYQMLLNNATFGFDILKTIWHFYLIFWQSKNWNDVHRQLLYNWKYFDK